MGVQSLAPPIIPGRTQIAPGAMRALLRNEAADDKSESEPMIEEQESQDPQDMLAEFGHLFWKAGEHPGLQDVMLSFAKALRKQSDQRSISMMTSPPLLRTPDDTMPPQMAMPRMAMAGPEQSAPQGDLLAALLGGLRQ